MLLWKFRFQKAVQETSAFPAFLLVLTTESGTLLSFIRLIGSTYDIMQLTYNIADKEPIETGRN